MTDIVAKTPGSWPGPKQSGRGRPDDDQSTAPRSLPGKNMDLGGASEAAEAADPHDDNISSYTHQKEGDAHDADLQELDPEPEAEAEAAAGAGESAAGDAAKETGSWSKGWSRENVAAKAEMAMKAKSLFDQASKARSAAAQKGAGSNGVVDGAEMPNGSEMPNGTEFHNAAEKIDASDPQAQIEELSPEEKEKLAEELQGAAGDAPETAQGAADAAVKPTEEIAEKGEEAVGETAETAEGLKDEAEKPVEDVTKEAEKPVEDVTKEAEKPVEEVAKQGEKLTEEVPEAVKEPEKSVEEATKEPEKALDAVPETVTKATEEIPAEVAKTAEETPAEAQKAVDEVPADVEKTTEKVPETAEKVAADAPATAEKAVEEVPAEAEEAAEAAEGVVEAAPIAVEQLPEQIQEKLPEEVKEAGEIKPEDAAQLAEELTPTELGAIPEELQKQLAFSLNVEQISQLPEGVRKALAESLSPEDFERLPEDVREAFQAAKPDLSILKGGIVNKVGNVVVDGKVVGRVKEFSGSLKQLIGKKVDEQGAIWSDSGKILGKAELMPDDELEDKEPAPFESFPEAVVDGEGYVIAYVGSSDRIGKVVEGDIKVLRGKQVDSDGDILDRGGNVIGKAERWEPEPEPEAEPEPEEDLSALAGGRVNKTGNVTVDGRVVGRIKEGVLANLVGKKVDSKGQIWSDSGKIIGKAELIPDNELDELNKQPKPFEAFPNAVVDAEGFVVSNGEKVGKVDSGDIKVLRGKTVDADGDILDRAGETIGHAVRWEPEPEPEPEPEAEIDYSILAGKRVNKLGNIVDSSGVIYGRVVQGDVKRMVGRMCDKKGNILSESGDIIGKAELVSEGEREGSREGPFAELEGLTVRKDGMVVTPGGDVVGKLTKGDGKVLAGRLVDEDGDVIDKNGNVLGHAERYEEPEPEPEAEPERGPMYGRRVNRQGDVVDEDGNVIGKLTSGTLSVCIGKSINEDDDVVNSKGAVIGHVSLLEDIPEPEPEPEPQGETEEERKEREKVENDKKLAAQMAGCLEQCLDKINPICKMITEKIDRAERTPKEELDEEALVKEVRPLIEEGGRILQEANGIIRGLDPDGRIQANAKHKSATREATPEEFHLAQVLKELTGNVSTTIDNAKKKLEGMPHAKKELNPLWGLLNEPLFQILAAVGLLLNGVLSLVGRLLSGLGLGGLLDGLLGTLGLNRVLDALGLGSVTESLTGGKKNKKKGGGLLGGVLGG